MCVEIWFDARLGQKGHKCGTFNINNKATGREIAKGERVGEKVGKSKKEKERDRESKRRECGEGKITIGSCLLLRLARPTSDFDLN